MVGWTFQKIHPMDSVVLTKDWSVHLPFFSFGIMYGRIGTSVYSRGFFPQNPSNVFHVFTTQPPETQTSVNLL